MQTSSSSSSSPLPPNDNNSNTNNQILLERFLASIKSDVTRSSALSYIHKYMRHWHLYEKRGGEEGGHDNDNEGDNDDDGSAFYHYRYDWLIGNEDVQTIQNKIIQFVIDKKKEGLGARAIDNYVNHLRRFYRVNSGIRGGGIDWELVKSYMPDYVKKTQDREYRADEVIAIEEKLDVRGKVVSGVMRGSGVRRGAERLINVGDLFPIQTKNYGKIYKIWVYRGSRDEYATVCTPEVAKRIDDYFEYRMRFGEVCKLH